jgi:hypothetical protein
MLENEIENKREKEGEKRERERERERERSCKGRRPESMQRRQLSLSG